MGFGAGIARAFGFKAVGGGDGGTVLQRLGLGGEPPRRGAKQVLESYGSSPWVRMAAHKTASAVGGTVWNLYRVRNSAARQRIARMPAAQRRKALAKLQRDQRVTKAPSDAQQLHQVDAHPLLERLDRPNPRHSGFDLLFLTNLWLDLKGEAFWILDPFADSAGKEIAEIYPVPPHWITEFPTKHRPTYRVRMDGGAEWEVASEFVIAFIDPDPVNPMGRGAGIGDAVADSIDVDAYARKRLRSFFWNQCAPDVLVSAEGEVSADELKRMRVEWENSHRGFFNAFRTFWTKAKLTVTRLDQSFKDMRLIEIRTFERNTIVQVWGLPPEMVGILDHSNRATITSAEYLFGAHSVDPRMDRIARTVQARLVVPFFGEDLLLDYDSPIPGDRDFQLKVMQAKPDAFTANEWRTLATLAPLEEATEKRGELYAYHLEYGVATLNEVRAYLGLPPVANGDAPPGPMLGASAQSTEDAAKAVRQWAIRAGLSSAQEAQLVESVRLRALPPATIEQLASVGRQAGGQAKDAAADGDGDGEDEEGGPSQKDAEAFADSVLEALRPERLTRALDPVFREQLEKWGRRVLRELNAEPTFDLLNPRFTAHLEQLGAERVGMVTDTTKERLRATLVEGVRAGEDVRTLAKRVRDEMDGEASKARAQNIARTECCRSANFGTVEAFKVSGVVNKKQWLATVPDPLDRTRDDHVALHRQTVELDGRFNVAGMSTDHPGGFGVAKEDCNCRCTVVAAGGLFDDLDPDASTDGTQDDKAAKDGTAEPLHTEKEATAWKAFVDDVAPWQRAAADAVGHAFGQQADDLVDRLGQVKLPQ